MSDLVERLRKDAETYKSLYGFDSKITLEAAERIAELEADYKDLIYCVHTKVPNETRHETARRYIQERENRHYGPCEHPRPKQEQDNE